MTPEIPEHFSQRKTSPGEWGNPTLSVGKGTHGNGRIKASKCQKIM